MQQWTLCNHGGSRGNPEVIEGSVSGNTFLLTDSTKVPEKSGFRYVPSGWAVGAGQVTGNPVFEELDFGEMPTRPFAVV
jgi:hypothetical protein